jgi:hypothetical protein
MVLSPKPRRWIIRFSKKAPLSETALLRSMSAKEMGRSLAVEGTTSCEVLRFASS